jgi:hypothetical protein
MRSLKTLDSTGLTRSVRVNPRTQKGQRNQISNAKTRVTGGIEASVNQKPPTASTGTSASAAEGATELKNARSHRSETLEHRAKRPRYTRGLLWDDEEDLLSATAQYSLTAEPLPCIPLKEALNTDLMNTIRDHPDLFKVDCPVNIERFEELLVDHPNRPFVLSVCRALREGFWPFADTKCGDYPTTWDHSDRKPGCPEHAAFITKQVQTEVTKGRYSEAFGPDLLPGMYSSPVHAIPKPGTDTFRLINDQSAGDFSPNSMIHPDDVAGTCMDGIRSLRASLRAHREAYGDEELVIFKCDIQEAYRLLWMCREWQAKQVVTCGSDRHVDFCNCFGNRGSYKVFLSFASLVAWIAEHVKGICDLKVYIDDNASFERAGVVHYYKPYQRYFPAKQTQLLLLWDELRIPHEERKQIYGPVVPFIGFDVDPNAMTISLSDERRAKLLDKVRNFGKPGKRHSLKDFQSLAGYINWSFAVFPLLKPSLSAIYTKIAGKTQVSRPVRVNNSISKELQWFIKHASKASGIFLLKSVAWDPAMDVANATVCYADACMGGIAFWYPELRLGYQCRVPTHTSAPIFYWEAVAVCCAMVSPHTPNSSRLVVYTDNQNTVDIWHTLKATAPYNTTLMLAVDWLILHEIDARVLHVPGLDNTVADALSRFNNALALRLVPGIKVGLFQPPPQVLGALKK